MNSPGYGKTQNLIAQSSILKLNHDKVLYLRSKTEPKIKSWIYKTAALNLENEHHIVETCKPKSVSWTEYHTIGGWKHAAGKKSADLLRRLVPKKVT